MSKISDRLIAKNTIVLFIRMAFVMFVSLYTSRITLKVLGINDYGIYQTVCGIVTFLEFLNNALGSSTSRFITFEMGKDKPKLNELFSTVMLSHIILGILIVVIGETVGVWFINNKLLISNDRMTATMFAFHCSMVSTFFQIVKVPYNAEIIAHEKMNIYAFISIIETLLKLLLVYLVSKTPFDRLKIYALLMCFTNIITVMIYQIYCGRNFFETKSKLRIEKTFAKNVLMFSGWNLFSSSAASLANQGVTIVTNMFFSPSTVTIRTLALKVNGAIYQFIDSFRTAINPQIVKNVASNKHEKAKQMSLLSTKYSYFLMLLIVMPLFLMCEYVLKLWLIDVPFGLIEFTRITLIQGLFQVFDASLYVPIYASGKIKLNSIISPLFDLIQLPIVYTLFLFGFPPISLAYVELLCCAILGLVVKPFLLKYILNYELKEIFAMFIKCFIITIMSSIIPIIAYKRLFKMNFFSFVLIGIICVFSILTIVLVFDLNKKIFKLIVAKLKNDRIKL